MNLCSIICTYNPNKETLFNQISLLRNFGSVYIIDNSNIMDYKYLDKIENVFIVSPQKNIGTLAAYNTVINLDLKYDLYWLWDQDTIVSIDEAFRFINESNEIFKSDFSCVATTFYDKKNYVHPIFKDLILSKASTTLFYKIKVEKFLHFNFDDSLFMDYGDFDFTYEIYKSGARMRQIFIPKYNHEFGEKKRTFLGAIGKSSNFRVYMQGANTIKIIKKHGFFSFPSILLILRFFIFPFKELVIFNSATSLKYFYKGIFHGIMNRVNYFSSHSSL